MTVEHYLEACAYVLREKNKEIHFSLYKCLK